jgi:hypothetical protein
VQASPAATVTPSAPSGGSQTSQGSTGTVQVLGSGSQTSSGSTGTVQVGSPAGPGTSTAAPAGAGPHFLASVASSSPPASAAGAATTAGQAGIPVTTAATQGAPVPRTARVAGVNRTPAQGFTTAARQRFAAVVGTLPFTGLPLWLVALAGLAMLGLGSVSRRWSTA